MTRGLPFEALRILLVIIVIQLLVAVQGSILFHPSRRSHTTRTSFHRHHFVLLFQTIPASSFWILTNGLVFMVVFEQDRQRELLTGLSVVGTREGT